MRSEIVANGHIDLSTRFHRTSRARESAARGEIIVITIVVYGTHTKLLRFIERDEVAGALRHTRQCGLSARDGRAIDIRKGEVERAAEVAPRRRQKIEILLDRKFKTGHVD